MISVGYTPCPLDLLQSQLVLNIDYLSDTGLLGFGCYYSPKLPIVQTAGHSPLERN